MNSFTALSSYASSKSLSLDFARNLASSPRFQKALRVGAALTLVIGTNRLLSQLALNNLSRTRHWDWSEDIVMVTGGCNGIGELVCRKLASHGTKVVAVDLQPPQAPFPDNIFYYRLDVTSSQDISQIAKSIRQDVGEPTVLINNAGVASLKTILGESEEEIRRTFDVNVVAHFLLAREFLPWMIRQDHGHIITIASMASYITVASGVDYCASKAAALAFHEGLAQELRYKYNAKHVRTSVVHPTWIRTKMFHEALKRGSLRDILLEPNVVAEAITRLVLRGKSQQIFLPSYLGIVSGLRVFPTWLQEYFRGVRSELLDLTN